MPRQKIKLRKGEEGSANFRGEGSHPSGGSDYAPHGTRRFPSAETKSQGVTRRAKNKRARTGK